MSDRRAPQQARATKTRAKLLDAAATVVRREGVQAMTLARVAEEAGVSKGGLLYHFASKQELIGALLEHTLERTDAEHQTAVAGDRREEQRFLHDHDDDGELCGILSGASSLDEAASRIIALANAHGEDNASVVIAG